MKYKPYPKYKDSGVEWLGEIPEGWEIQKNAYHYRSAMGQTILKEDLEEDGDVPVYSATEKGEVFGFISRPRVQLSQGDFVIPARGVSIGFPVLVEEISTCTQTTIYMKSISNRCVPKYSFWYLLGNRHKLFEYDRTAIPQITVEQVASNRILLPPLSTQRTIATFLDTETARIDGLIKDYEDLIELLKEKRQALISHAVTRGLSELVSPDDPEFGEWAKPAKFKDSGVEWIGEIPEAWEVKRLKHISYSWCDGPFGSGLKSEHYSDEGARVVRLQNIGVLKFESEDAAYIALEYASGLGDHFIEPSDLLIAGLGDDNHPVGRCVVAPDDIGVAIVKADCFRFRLYPKNEAQFLALQLTATAVPYSKQASTGTTRERVNLSTMANRLIILPEPIEQNAIAIFLCRNAAKIDTLVSESESAIELLKEYRSALITNAVTGKISVEQTQE